MIATPSYWKGTHMSVDVRPTVVIARPRADVAAVMFDPAHDPVYGGRRRTIASDPWTAVGLLRITKIEPWDLLLGTS